ncbi:MAG: cation:proton antiporter [Actinomycetota bacterium]
MAGQLLVGIALIFASARVLGAIARRIGFPVVVGEIAAGVLLGPTILGRTGFSPFPPEVRPILNLIGQVGLVLFMAMVGLQLDLTPLRAGARSILLITLGVAAVSIVAGVVVGHYLYRASFVPQFATSAAPSKAGFLLMVGAMLSATAFPVVARILQEMRLAGSRIGTLTIATSAAVTLVTFLTAAVAGGLARRDGAWELASTFVYATLFVAALFLVVRPAMVPVARASKARGAATGPMWACFFAVVAAGAYVAGRIGITVVVGAFLIGVVMPARRLLAHEFSLRFSKPTSLLLLPIFFAYSGLNTDFRSLSGEAVGGFLLFVAVGAASNWLAGMLFGPWGGLSLCEANVVGILLNCRGLMVLVVGLVALEQGIISAPLHAAGVALSLLTTAVTGPLVRLFVERIPAADPAAGPP